MITDVLGKLVADKYRVESLVREGDSGDLFAARHEVMDTPVTIEILPQALGVDARWVKRFIDKARRASGVSHANVIRPTDFGTDAKGISYAVYEPVEGRNLREILAADLPFEAPRAVGFTRTIAGALTAGHARGVVHGAVSPKNIFVGEDDAVKVFGFGAEPMNVERDAEPQYLAPEQTTAFPAADERSDVYVLGVLLYEMITGVVPHDGATAADVAARRNTEPPPPMSAFNRDIHPEIEPILLTAIAGDPDRRYQTVAAFAEDLEILSTRVGSPEKAAAAAAGGSRKNILQTAVIALLGIAVLAGALIYATAGKKTDPTTELRADLGSFPVQPIGPATGAQEESLAKLPVMTDAEILATQTAMEMPGALPGGDGYNAWANGGAPPPGAPMAGAPLQQQYFPPGGQVYTIDGSQGSQFMPTDGSGVILVPVPMPANTAANTAVKPETQPKPPMANANVAPQTGPTPQKPLVAPIPKGGKPATTQPKEKPATPAKKPDDELERQ